MTEATRLWIHIGLPKTGTSAVQASFKQSRTALQAVGLIYPVAGELGGGHAKLAWPLLGEQRQSMADVLERIDSAGCHALWSELAAEVAQHSASDVLISSEYFSEVDPSELAKVARLVCDDVRILVYLRRQDELVESGYNQGIKAGLVSERFHTPGYLAEYDYSLVLGRWRAVFGSDNVVPRLYGGGAMRNGVVQDVAETLSLDLTLLRGAEATANPKMHPSLLEFQRIANSMGLADNGLIGTLERELVGLDEVVGGFFSSEERRKILEPYAESNRKVAREYFHRDDMLFDPPVAGDPGAPRIASNEVLAAALILVWEKMERMQAKPATDAGTE